MWLQNFYNILMANVYCDDSGSSSSTPGTPTQLPLRIRRPNGIWATVPNNEPANAVKPGESGALYYLLGIGKAPKTLLTDENVYMTYQAPVGIALGSGNTAAALTDYKLENIITSGLSLASIAGTRITASAVADNHIDSERQFIITCTSGPKTIKEFGLYGPGDIYGAASGVYSYNACLLYREVLAEPITLEQGESILLNFKVHGPILN